MSWQQYVDGSLVGSGHVTKAAIVGKDGSIWAKTEGWVIENDSMLNPQHACHLLCPVQLGC